MGLIKAALGAAVVYWQTSGKNIFTVTHWMRMFSPSKAKSGPPAARPTARGRTMSSPAAPLLPVADGQCMMIVEQGKVVELCAEPGEFVFDASTEPSLFAAS